MDSNEESLEELFYPFSWKTPLIYVVLCAAIGLYVYIFFIHREKEVFGVMERSKDTKVFLVFFMMIFFFVIFRFSPFVQSVESRFLRGMLLLGGLAIALVFLMPGWTYNKYDNQKMHTYMRIFPFKNSPYLEIREPLVYSNIKAIASSPGNDTGALRFRFTDGGRQSLDVNNIPLKSSNMFYLTLYTECDRLRGDIERECGSIDTIRTRAESQEGKTYITGLHVLIFTFGIFSFFVLSICLIVYAFQMRV